MNNIFYIIGIVVAAGSPYAETVAGRGEAWNIRDRCGTAAAHRAEDLAGMQSDKCRLFRFGVQFASKATVPVIGTHTSGKWGKC
jgi:hypothetical protein